MLKEQPGEIPIDALSHPIVAGALLGREFSNDRLPGDNDNLDWLSNLTIVDGADVCTVTVCYWKNQLRTFQIPQVLKPLLFLNPLDQTVFDVVENGNEKRKKRTNGKFKPDESDEKQLVLYARQDAEAYARLSPVVETILLIRWAAGDLSAQERLFRSNMCLAWGPARRTTSKLNGKIKFLDLLQEAYLGMMKALEKFDFSLTGKETPMMRISTYMTTWIKQRVNRFTDKTIRVVRIPVHRQTFYKQMQRKIAILEQCRIELTEENIALAFMYRIDQIKIRTGSASPKLLKEYANILKRVIIALSTRPEISLQKPVDDGDGEIVDFIPNEDPQPHLVVENDILRETLLAIIDELRLSDMQRDIVCRKYGLYGGEETLQEIGDSYGLTRERIRQILVQKVLRRMKHPKYRRLLPKLL